VEVDDRAHDAAIAAARRLPTALVAAAGATILLAAITAPDLPIVFGGVALGLLLLVPAFRRLTPRGTLVLAGGLPAAVLLRGVLTFGFFTADAYVALLLQEWRGEPPLLTALAFTTTSLAWSAGAWIQARSIERRGARYFVGRGALLVVAGVVLSMPALLPAVPAWIVVATFPLAGFGMGFAYAAVAIVVLRDAPPAEQGSSSAALQLSDILGTALGAGLGGAIIAVGARAGGDGVGIGLAVTFAVAAVAMVGTWLGSARLGPRRPGPIARTAAVD
jgi:MFS family permease